MSVIVVVKKAGKLVIAADTLYSFGKTKVTPKYISNRSKIHRFKNSYIGITGASATDNVFEHLTEKHKKHISFDTKKDIFNTYLKLHPILKEEYFMNVDEDNDNTYESSQITALIANPNGIFGIYSWREVYEFDKFWAIGSGEDYALGSLFSTYDLFDEPEQIAEAAIAAACEFDDGCGLPMVTHTVQLAK